MFADPEVVRASRKFVCVRIESYESEENQQLIRKHLGGTFANTACSVLAPDGTTRLTRSGRSVSRLFGPRVTLAQGLDSVARRYPGRQGQNKPLTPDFHSFRQALNVSAADQRVLVLVADSAEEMPKLEERMRSVAWHRDLVGRFHFDLEDTPEAWQSKLEGAEETKSGIFLVKPSQFGDKGTVLCHVPVGATDEALLEALSEANRVYSRTTKKTQYEKHVAEGKRKGIFFEMAMPFGEDRDGNGKVDSRPKARFDRARRWAERTGNLIPLEKPNRK